MIEPTDEMVEAFRVAWHEKAVELVASGATSIDGSLATRAGLAAVLAILARDRCMERRGHVHHPLRKRTPTWLPRRGANHPHFCVSCSDGDGQGPGCINCRRTGMDQTPWPHCKECAP